MTCNGEYNLDGGKYFKLDLLFISVSQYKVKEIVERRHGEPIKFLFLPKMGLLGSQASTEKKMVVNSEKLLRAV